MQEVNIVSSMTLNFQIIFSSGTKGREGTTIQHDHRRQSQAVRQAAHS